MKMTTGHGLEQYIVTQNIVLSKSQYVEPKFFFFFHDINVKLI